MPGLILTVSLQCIHLKVSILKQNVKTIVSLSKLIIYKSSVVYCTKKVYFIYKLNSIVPVASTPPPPPQEGHRTLFFSMSRKILDYVQSMISAKVASSYIIND